MARINVSDFYMSGDAVSVARDASAIIPGEECRSLMDDVLLFLLSNQYVTSSLLLPVCGLRQQAVVWG